MGTFVWLVVWVFADAIERASQCSPSKTAVLLIRNVPKSNFGRSSMAGPGFSLHQQMPPSTGGKPVPEGGVEEAAPPYRMVAQPSWLRSRTRQRRTAPVWGAPTTPPG